MTDVVLPCLNEAPAPAALLARLPDGYRATVAHKRATHRPAALAPPLAPLRPRRRGGSRAVLPYNGPPGGWAELPRRLGARVVRGPQPGYGAPVHAGIVAGAPADQVVCVMDADGSFAPAELPRVA